MANGPKIFDPATTQAMLNAFDTAQNECQTIQAGVNAAGSNLAAAWKGGASVSFGGSMSSWEEGFHKVQSALATLNDSMSYYRTLLSTVEDTNTSQGSWAH